jgi:hypothetical protein
MSVRVRGPSSRRRRLFGRDRYRPVKRIAVRISSTDVRVSESEPNINAVHADGEGTHQELLARCGIYRELCRDQFIVPAEYDLEKYADVALVSNESRRVTPLPTLDARSFAPRASEIPATSASRLKRNSFATIGLGPL